MEPWVCPHCASSWSATQGKCYQCWWGTDLWQAPEAASDTAGPSPAAPLLPPPSAALDGAAGLEAARLTQYLYQSQAESVKLAQKVDELSAHLAQERAKVGQTLQAVHRLLAPLLEYWQARDQTLTLEQVIPATLRALTPTPAPPADHAPLIRALDALRHTIVQLQQSFTPEAAPAVAVPSVLGPPLEPYPTYLQTDARTADLEAQIAMQDRLRGEGYHGR